MLLWKGIEKDYPLFSSSPWMKVEKYIIVVCNVTLAERI